MYISKSSFVYGAVSAFATLAQLRAGQPASPSATGERAVVTRYCATCHSERAKVAGLSLEKLDMAKVGEQAPVWEKVVRKIRTGAMPPPGMPRPEPATLDSLVQYLETALDKAVAMHPNPGRPSVHRLNRTEYTNSIRDLLAINIDGDALLPADDTSFGFDNIGDVLSVSPVLLERYMSAARKVSRLAVGDPAINKPVFETYTVSKFLKQDDRMSEDLPFGSRGGMAIHHRFPFDGEYVIKVRLRRNYRDYIVGLAEAHQFEVRLDGGARVKLFTVGGEHKGKSAPFFSANNALGDPSQEAYERSADEGFDVRVPVKAGTHLLSVDFLGENAMPEGPQRPGLTQLGFVQYKGGNPAVETVTVSGPYNSTGSADTPSRRKIFVCHPARAAEELPCAKKILSNLARRAYRRPVTDSDMDVLLSLYRAGGKKGGFEAGIQLALRRILGPEFLFRVEYDPANVPADTAYRISDIELASRLSFFLWSSIPDEQLLDLAVAGELKDPAILDAQVRRMLADERSRTLVSNFAAQWLSLRNLRLAKPDAEEFPDFDDNLRQGFEQETELFLQSMLTEDHSVLDLLNANYTFLNERLARHYGIPGVYGSHFRRVALTGGQRGGLLTQGSILTVTSYANRTSPTIRGQWILDNILGTPPPPPPPNVPSLPESKDSKAMSMRQRMEMHRASPACASCHVRMDPMGFSLENFDGVGKWRTTSGAGLPIDASAVLPGGIKFDGPAGLRKSLTSSPDQFATTVTEKLLTYALGRGVSYSDQPAVRKILRDAAAGGYRWSALILGIVKSTSFQMRMSGDHTSTPEPSKQEKT